MSDGALLITGADGYLGRLLVWHELATTDRPLVLWVRAGSDGEAARRCAAAYGSAVLSNRRIRCTGGDLRDPEPFAGVVPGQISAIAHLAAVTAFTVDALTATRVNLDGTAKVLAFARRARALTRVCLASTLYASGLRSGAVPERAITERPTFANEYERSKWEAERLALGDPDLPVTVVRTATVLADDCSGRTGQRNAVHHTLALLRHGLLSLMPGDPVTPVYLTTGEIAVRAIAAAVDRGSGVYQVADRASESLTLGRALDVAFECFTADERFLRRRTRRPLFADLRTFQMLAGATRSLGGSVLGQAVGSLEPFAAQLYVTKQVDNDRYRALVGAAEPLDAESLFAATCARLADPEWDSRDRSA